MYIILCVFLFALATCFFIVGFTAQNPTEKGKFAVEFLGMNKKDAILFTAYGMGGVLTAIGLVALGRRAEAQVRNNELTELGHIEERFKSATTILGNDRSGARIAAFYQFYYLAKDNKDPNFRKNIFEILCAYLRDMTDRDSYRMGEGKDKPTVECQSLLDVLFKSEDESVFAGFRANLRYTYLVGADLPQSRMENADFSFANLRSVDLRHAKLERARLDCVDDLTNALLVGVEIDLTNMTSCPPQGKWNFYADGELAKFSKADAPRKPISKHEGGWGDPPNFGDES